MKVLSVSELESQSRHFVESLSSVLIGEDWTSLDGKTIGTGVELLFKDFLVSRGFHFVSGNAASGLDFPELLVDVKVSRDKKPQHSCPFRSIEQKVYGLGYGLLLFTYGREPGENGIRMKKVRYIPREETSDRRVTTRLHALLSSGADFRDIQMFLSGVFS